jgi:glycosyltransferase involved in cell wall biosynthesis
MTEKLIALLSDSREGGAAIAANRLEQGLILLGQPLVRWYFSPPPPRIPKHHQSLDPQRKRPPFERVLKNIARPAAQFLRHRRHTRILEENLRLRTPALLNVHNLHGSGLDHRSLELWPVDQPLVWTLHDCWAFQPAAFSWSQQGETQTAAAERSTSRAIKRRDAFFAQKRALTLVAPSRWLGAEAEKKLARKISVIPYGLDTEIFKPVNSAEAQQRLNLDPSRIWIGFASTWANDRKGADLLKAALTGLDSQQFGFLAWGAQLSDRAEFPLPVHHVGPVQQDARLRELYSACDLFLCPSRADNFPNTVLEALACGTPVVGSRAGGIPEMVREGETGWLHETDSSEALRHALTDALRERDRWVDYRHRARAVAEKEYPLKLQAERYAALFAELLGD